MKHQQPQLALVEPEEHPEDFAAYEVSIVRKPSSAAPRKICTVSCPDAAAEYLFDLGLAESMQEHFVVLMLDTRNHIIAHTVVTTGLLDRSHCHPREVFRSAVLYGTSKIIIAHNHPSGDVAPSRQDILSTENLIEAGNIIGIKVVDHIVVGYDLKVGSRSFVSMRVKSSVNFEVDRSRAA
jgi:DNA repair protein RadC